MLKTAPVVDTMPLRPLLPPVPDADLIKLSLLLGRNWPKALQLVEQGAVRCFQGDTSGRRVFQVNKRQRQPA